ncbi:hypothetical protein T10_5614 [Trichinella papuae]|uniref:Retrovirus-related Pol polyprotein from transposon TNT 1-94 n=1 Tax=Trichinella papuae TaxID=268474 RepID=A0A0V1NBN8_9BILA|nr:hypothetical protein T10_5614 [Trichinella papuae]
MLELQEGSYWSECRSQRKTNSSISMDGQRPTNRAELIVRSGVDLYRPRNDRWLADSGAFKHITRNYR